MKIFIAFFLVISATLLPLGCYSYYQASENLISQEKRNVKEQILQANNNLSNYAVQCQTIAGSLLYNLRIRECLEKEDIGYFDQYLMFSNILEPEIGNIMGANPNLQDVRIYTDNRTLQNHSRYLYALEKLLEEKYPKQNYYIQKNNLIMQSSFPKGEKGLTHILCLEFRIRESLSVLLKKQYLLYLVASDGTMVYQSDEDFSEKAWDVLENGAVIQKDQKQYYLMKAHLDAMGWTEYCLIPVESLTVDVSGILRATALHYVLALGISLLFSVIFGKWITAPIEKLQKNIQEIEVGNFSTVLESDAGDEIGALTNSFGRMTQKLNALINEVYKSELTRRKAEFKMLQAQLNPHFLYNTLSFINWTAFRAGQKEIAKISRDISDFYRTALNQGNVETKVEHEIKNASSYLEIQLALHHNSFDVEYDIEEQCREKNTICNILQPLLENALEHGIDQKTEGRGKIEIHVEERQKKIIFRVIDNGPGLEEKSEQKESKGYGVKNVNERIHIFYGEEYGLTLRREKDITISEIVIPELEEQQMERQNDKLGQ